MPLTIAAALVVRMREMELMEASLALPVRRRGRLRTSSLSSSPAKAARKSYKSLDLRLMCIKEIYFQHDNTDKLS